MLSPLAILLLLLLPTLTLASCPLPLLTNVTTSLLTHQRRPALNSTFTSFLTANTTFLQNRHPIPLTSSILNTPLNVVHARSQHDEYACATYSEFIVLQPVGYVLGVQIRLFDDGDALGKVKSVQSVVTTNGDWLFDANSTLRYASREKWDEIPDGKRDAREVIKAAADAYCDLFNDKSVKVPWGSPCARLEGGIYTGNGSATDRCDVGVPSGVKLVNRDYVIDVAYGTVDIMMDFAGEEGQVGKSGLPDSHEFRVEGGKLRYVHTMSSCGGKACF